MGVETGKNDYDITAQQVWGFFGDIMKIFWNSGDGKQHDECPGNA